MQRVNFSVEGYQLDFEQAKETGRLIAEKENEFATLVS